MWFFKKKSVKPFVKVDLGKGVILVQLKDGQEFKSRVRGNFMWTSERYSYIDAHEVAANSIKDRSIGGLYKIRSGYYVPTQDLKSVTYTIEEYIVDAPWREI